MKKELRKQIKQTLGGLTVEQLLSRSLRAAQRMVELDEFQQSKIIMLYLTIPGEVDTAAIAHAAWAAGKTVTAPKACPDTRHMRPVVCYPDQEEIFHPHQGLRTPAGQHIVDIGDIDLVVVPALAFDEKTNRLGRGGGFYDRFLDRDNFRAITIGLAFDEQIVPKVPIYPNDKPVDIVITDRRVLRRHNRSKSK